MDNDNLIETENPYTWVKCGHDNVEYSILLSDKFNAYFMCCPSCYERLLGHFIKELIKPFEKLTRKIK